MDKFQNVGSCTISAPCLSWACAFIAKKRFNRKGRVSWQRPARMARWKLSPLHRVRSRKKTSNRHRTHNLIRSSMIQIRVPRDFPLVVIKLSARKESLRSVTYECSTSDHLQPSWELHYGLLINRAGIHTRERSRDWSFSDRAICHVRCCIRLRATATRDNLKTTTPCQ